MSVTKKLYGTLPTGEDVYAYTLTNENGLSAEIINYGAIITKLIVKDKNGAEHDVVLGRASIKEYLNNDGYIGAAIGRHANRIACGKFDINGMEYNVGINENGNSLHGGKDGFDKKLWNVTEYENAVLMTCVSPDGEEGFPGTMIVSIKYSVTESNALKIEYNAVCDKDTVCNLTNHSYFNLNGHESGKIYSHELMINADFYTPNDSECMPTGEIEAVCDTPFDFRQPKEIGKDIDADHEQIQAVSGFDHNYVIKGTGYRLAAVVRGNETGITMEVHTNQPGMQLYTANALPSGVNKSGYEYQVHDALCLETQLFPNSMANPHFPTPVLRKNQVYSHITEYKFL